MLLVAVFVLGSNVTLAPLTRAGSGTWKNGSPRAALVDSLHPIPPTLGKRSLHVGAKHLALLGLATILVLLVVIMSEVMSPLIALIAVPIAGALAGGLRAARSSDILFVPCEDIFPSVLRGQGTVVDTVGCKDGMPGIVIRMEFVRLAKLCEFGFHFGYMFL